MKKRVDLYGFSVKKLTNWQVSLVAGAIFIGVGILLILLNKPFAIGFKIAVVSILLLGSLVMGISAFAMIRTKRATGEPAPGVPTLVIALLLLVSSGAILYFETIGYLFISIISLGVLIEGFFNLMMGIQILKKTHYSYYYIVSGAISVIGALSILVFSIIQIFSDSSDVTVHAGQIIIGCIGVKSILIGITTLLMAHAAKKELAGNGLYSKMDSNFSSTMDVEDAEVIEIIEPDDLEL